MSIHRARQILSNHHRQIAPTRYHSRKPRILALGLMCLTCSLTALAGDHDDIVVTEIANSWIGHNASELLTQWPVDSGFNMSEIPKTNETAYSYNFGIRAHINTYNVEDGMEPVGTDATGGLIMAEKYHTEKEYVQQKIVCDVTFYANAQGIITHYEYRGTTCRPNFKHWGKPKS